MKTWSKLIPVFLGVWGWVLATTSGLPAAPGDEGAIQAIQQATDPSAAVTAFANGFAVDRNNPKLYDAYVTRMVDLGLPELAYHQAEALTTLDGNNGLAWGVVGYVNARRGDMPAAISAIVLAGQGAPSNQFVQRTAGEILAWYDLKADKSQIPDNAKSGLDALRARFNTSAAFAQAYDTAKKAYASQTSMQQQAPAAQQPAPAQPEYQVQPYSGGTTVAYAEPPPYYGGYYYDWGPGWVSPSWWWYPCGFWGGFTFFPFSSVVVFNDHHHHDFDHHHHDHDGIHVHDGQAFHQNLNNKAVWHGGANGQAKFFGTPAQPNVSRVSRPATLAGGITTANSAFTSSAGRPNSMSTVRAASTMSAAADPPMAQRAAPASMTAPRTAPATLASPRTATAAPAAPAAAPAMSAQSRTAPATLAQPRTAPATLAQPRTAPTRTAPAMTAPRSMAQPTAPATVHAAPSVGMGGGASHQAFASMGRAGGGGGGAMHGGGGGGGAQGGGGGGGHGGGGGGHR